MNKIKKAFLVGLATAFVAGNVTAKPLNNFIVRKSRELYEKVGKVLYEQQNKHGYDVTGYVVGMRKENGITILYVKPEKPFVIYDGEGNNVGVYNKVIVIAPKNAPKNELKIGKEYTFRIENDGIPGFGKDNMSYDPLPSLWASDMKESP